MVAISHPPRECLSDRGPGTVTVPGIVAAARRLLVTRGLEAITMRNVATLLGVGAPALYRHLRGREEILDRLTATCLDELSSAVAAARDAEAPDEHHRRILAAGLALYDWAHTHPAEFALAFATPATVRRPLDGLGYLAGRRLGLEFLRIIEAAAQAGRLLPDAHPDIPDDVTSRLRTFREDYGLGLDDRQLWTAVRSFHDLLGLVMVEAMGQLGYAWPDRETGSYMHHRLKHLAAGVIAP